MLRVGRVGGRVMKKCTASELHCKMAGPICYWSVRVTCVRSGTAPAVT